MGFCHIHRRIADGFSDANTDGITDGLSHACLTRVRLHYYRRNYRCQIPTALPTDHACLTMSVCTNTDSISDVIYRRITHVWHVSSAPLPTELPTDRKAWWDFRTFLVRILINFWRNYRRKLIAPTAINFCRKYCFIYRHPPPYFLLFSLSPLLSSSPFRPCSPLLPFSSSLIYI